MAKWMTQEPERRKKSIEDKKKRLEQRRAEPKHYFNDPTYMTQIISNEDAIDSALQQGIQAASSATTIKGTKRKILDESSSKSRKKPKIW